MKKILLVLLVYTCVFPIKSMEGFFWPRCPCPTCELEAFRLEPTEILGAPLPEVLNTVDCYKHADDVSSCDSQTKFFKAILKGDEKSVCNLSEQGVDLMAEYSGEEFLLRSCTPLQLAVKVRKYDIACLLLAKGVQVTATEYHSPLHDVVKDMLELSKNNKGESIDEHLKLTALLLRHGADICTQTYLNETIFHIIWQHKYLSNHRQVYAELLKVIFRGADAQKASESVKKALFIKDNCGATVLDNACKNYADCTHEFMCCAQYVLGLRDDFKAILASNNKKSMLKE